MLPDNNAYLLLILFILAKIYLGWEIKKRNKVKTAKNMKNRNIYSLDDLVLCTYFGFHFSAEPTLITAGNLLRSTIYITFNLTVIQHQSNNHSTTA